MTDDDPQAGVVQPARPAWVRFALIAAVIAAVLLIVLMVLGGHGPGRHLHGAPPTSGAAAPPGALEA